MRVIEIHDKAPQGFLSFDLKEILHCLGEDALEREWWLKNVESTGPASEELHALELTKALITGRELAALAERIGQTIWGDFLGRRPGETAVDLRISAIDSTLWEVSAKDDCLQKIRAAFKDVRPGHSGTASTMRYLIRLVAMLAALCVLGTVWFIAAFPGVSGVRGLLNAGWLGGLTLGGWGIALVAGPVAAVQLWRFRESGRHAGIILFGYGVTYYVAGLFVLRSPEASILAILADAMIFALPLVVLLLPRTRTLFAAAKANAARDQPL